MTTPNEDLEVICITPVKSNKGRYTYYLVRLSTGDIAEVTELDLRSYRRFQRKVALFTGKLYDYVAPIDRYMLTRGLSVTDLKPSRAQWHQAVLHWLEVGRKAEADRDAAAGMTGLS